MSVSTIVNNRLITHSFYIFFSSVVTSAFGFFFWVIAAKLYSTVDIGISTALISISALIVILTNLGLDQTMIKYIHAEERGKLFSSIAFVTTSIGSSTATIISVILVLSTNYITIEMGLLAIVPLVCLNALFNMVSIALLSLHLSKHYFLLYFIMCVKLPFLVILIPLEQGGIIFSMVFAYIFALLISIPFLRNNLISIKKPDWHLLRKFFYFSMANYFSGIFIFIPGLILPVIILLFLGPESTAVFYIVFSIASVVFSIPGSITTSLFIEESHGQNTRNNSINAIIISFFTLILAFIFFLYFGFELLHFIGESYAQKGYGLLIMMTLSSFFMSIYLTNYTIYKINNKIKLQIITSGISTLILISLSIIGIYCFGLIGVGYAWIIGYFLSSTIQYIIDKFGTFFSLH